MNNKTALITGITGQDGSFLAELLLSKGYRVFGLTRRNSWYGTHCSSHLKNQIEVLFGDMAEGVDIASAIESAQPDEIYNLASQSRPSESWEQVSQYLSVNGHGAVRLFEAVRHHCPACRIYQASSSEMFGQVEVSPQSEQTPFNPVNPYAAAKLYAHHMARIYRESYDMYIATGILFNHESERRPLHFLTQKVAYGAACASLGINDSPDLNERGMPIVQNGKLVLGNFDIARDWGFAGDVVVSMWLTLQRSQADDFVIGTGKLHTLRELCEIAYHCVGKDWEAHVITDARLLRPLEVGQTLADSAKANTVLGWRPTLDFSAMVSRMVYTQREKLSKISAK
ncbi:MAG: GDP-mannose 4,6-dehydratase [Desulfobulbaceae bacterium A2]|nr:MAG: GDP-mannose 4,6-dehydratase [Desulfobulbaceae bacterium A2]